MSVRSAVSAGQRDEGFSLIELLVAISLIGIIMSGLAFGITNSLTITRDSRERTIAANLASGEIDLANSIPNTNLSPGTLERLERVGVTDFTIRRVSTWESGTPEAPACTALANSASGQGRRFLQVNVTVTWQGIGLRAPVQASTAITPSVATYTELKGHVAVTVSDRAGQPLAGIPVTLSWNGAAPAPPGVPRTVMTTSIGCAFFTDFDPGPYQVSVNQAGYVDSADGTQLGTEDVTVGDRETAKAGFTYDRRTGLDVLVAGDSGAVVPNELVVTAQANDTPYPQRTSATGTGNDPRRTMGLIPDPGLFPYTGGWTAWAGCDHNDPIDFPGGTRAAFNPAPGVPAPQGTVAGGTLNISILTRDSTRGGSALYARDQTATSAPCNALVEVGRFDTNGRLTSRSVVLPYGNWKLFVEGSVVALNGDPSKVDGLIEVRPVVTATYTESLNYVAQVLADGPFLYYRLDENPTWSAADSSGFERTGVYQSGVTRGLASVNSTLGRALSLDGSANGTVTTPTTFTNPSPLTLEIWFRTATSGYNQGGRLAGFGDTQTGTSTQFDRHLYMLDTGELVFGVYSGTQRVVRSGTALYNDGQWHHAVATVGAGGMALYVDGTRIALDTTVTSAQNYTGYVRVGYDNLGSGGWPGPPTSRGFQGQVDEFAFYTTALSQTRVTAHWNARSDGTYGTAVVADAPQLYYRFHDGTFDFSGNTRRGTYQSGATGGIVSALLNDANTAINLDGTAAGYVSTYSLITSPTSFSIELWLRASAANGGGRLLGFGNARTGTSATTTSDRHLYMRNDGRLSFGVYGSSATSRRAIHSPLRYDDGQWHHVVATFGTGPLGPGEMLLYVDGAQVQTSLQTAGSTNYSGYWRVGADTLSGWAFAPTNAGFNGDVDEVAVYTSVLSPERIAVHYAASGR